MLCLHVAFGGCNDKLTLNFPPTTLSSGLATCEKGPFDPNEGYQEHNGGNKNNKSSDNTNSHSTSNLSSNRNNSRKLGPGRRSRMTRSVAGYVALPLMAGEAQAGDLGFGFRV